MVQTEEPITFPARLNAVEAAHYLGVSKPTMLRALQTKQVPARRLGRRWIIDRAALDEWLRANEQPEPKDAV